MKNFFFRYVHEITGAIEEHICHRKIHFPRTRREINQSKESFMEKFQFPGVVGALDGTHIAIVKPKEDEHNFINRKGFHSINVLIVCDANLKILFINANYPGSSHDSFVWRNSGLRQHLLHNHMLNVTRGAWLLGDSGYPLEPFVMTPIANAAVNSPEARYNDAHTRARNCVERCIGVLKTRFRCLLRERVARYDPQFVGKLVNVCAALHNMCLDHNLQLDEEVAHPDDEYPYIPPAEIVQGPLYNEAQRVRNNIVNTYFN